MASETILVDANSLIHRAYHAISSSLSTSTGQPTNAVYGFAQMLLQLLQQKYPSPDKVILAFDAEGPTFRDEISEDYKADRPPMDEELAAQLDTIRQLAGAMNLVNTELEGYEADDIIGTLAKRASDAGEEVVIVTGDRDLCQLVDDNVRVLANIKGISETKLYDAAAVKEEFGVSPDRLPDQKGLAGDSSDNIPGIPRIGPKTAQKLLDQFASVEDIYDNADAVDRQKLRERLQEYEDDARMSKRLAEIDRDAPVDDDLLQKKWTEFDLETLRELMAKLEFTSLLQRLPAADNEDVQFHTLETPKQIENLCADVRDCGEMAIAMAEVDDTPVGLAIACPHADAAYMKLSEPENDGGLFADDGEKFPAEVRDLLADEDIAKVGHDLKSIAHQLQDMGLEMSGFGFDTSVAAYLIAPQQGHQEVATIIGRQFGETLPAVDAADDDSNNEKDRASRAARRAVREAQALLRLRQPLLEELEEIEERQLFEQIEMPLVPILLKMENAGIGVDEQRFEQIGDKLNGRIIELSNKIYDIAGEQFNIDSPKQVGEILFDKLGLPPGKRTKTGYSTSASVLEKLAADHEIASLILKYREFSKLKSTYVDGMLPLIDPDDGRIHTTLQQTVVATGRLSSRNPNLQNIPARSDFGRQVRSCFVAQGEDNILLDADYSQVELRILAHNSGDERLVEAFRAGKDIHKATACQIFGTELQDVDRQMRQMAKTVNYAVIYGMGATALASQLGVQRSQAKKFIEDYFDRLPQVQAYMEGTVQQAREDGYVTTLYGRRRPIPDIDSSNGRTRAYAERAAANAPLQGTAADIIKMAMIELDQKLPDICPDCRMLLQVHDDLLFELPQGELQQVADTVKEVMEGVADLDVPLEVEPKAGRNWRDMDPV